MIFTLATMALALSAVKADTRELEGDSCNGTNACFNMTDNVSFGCNGKDACLQKKGDVLGSSDFLSCSGDGSCHGMDGEVSFGCTDHQACYYKEGDVLGTADNPSCTGVASCYESTGTINKGACTGEWSCIGAAEEVPEGCCTQPCACTNCSNLEFASDIEQCNSGCEMRTPEDGPFNRPVPTESCLANKTDDLDNDANTLEFAGNGTSKYNTTTNTLTVQLERGSFYSNFTPNVTLWAINTSVPLVETVCGVGSSTAAADNVELSGGLTSVSSKTNSEVFSQDILMNLTDMEESNVYFDTSATEGAIKFCIRADYKLDDMSVGFAETLVDLAVNMTVGFEVSVGMKRDAPTSQEVEADYEVLACICDSSYICVDNPVISQNSEMRVCLFSPSDGLKIDKVQQLDVNQVGLTQFSPVNDKLPLPGLTTVEPFAINSKVVITRALTKLFEYADPPDIAIVGSVSLEFLSNERRVLEENVFADGTETDVEKSASGAFELKVRLKPITDLEEFVEDDKEKKDIVVVEGQEKEDVDAPGESAGTSVPINMIVGVVEAVAFIMMLAVAF